ncbi:2Fe-2S iron-sulfur cluster binding domain-containing protein [Synechococcus sp. PCC 6312]|uniref:2Fe-2S iron-sulfur cluster binding domain-containing protein n=1 Tax=Synechococcus sp. (strain ATCC 27167 / PCC 6312) TaxID=195253 RepID=UPI00029EF1FC|nr:2Fe-2S iron-sulfur cluster binding domain-containing protein [Synechococcus sp. PCC 6312]AFY60938.1 ferredoxin [Synechococcus sp. PCC 6312]
MPESITICFQSEGVTIQASVGDSWLEVAHQAGIEIPTGCLQGSCGACTVEVEELGEVRTCISAIPPGQAQYTVYLFRDPTW